jgi:hypothetical protein
VPLLRTASDERSPSDEELTDISRQLRPLAEAGVRYVVIHKDQASEEALDGWRKWFGFRPVYEDEELLAYQTEPQYGRDFEFVEEIGDGVGVIGATLAASVVTPGESVEVEVVWGTHQPVRREWMAYLTLVGPTGQEGQRVLFEPSLGWPTPEWGSNAVARGRGVLPVDPSAESGKYTVAIGLIDPVANTEAGEPVAVGRVTVRE